MTVDLTALEAADAALQKSTSAAASTKAMSAANLAAWKAAYPVVTPPTGIVKAAFVVASGDSGFVASLPAMLAAGYNTFKFPSEWSNSVAAVAKAGAKAWLTSGAFYNSGANAGTFELTAAQQIADLEAAFKVIPVGDCYIYLADEPRVGSTQDRNTLYSRMAQIRSAIPGAKFVIAYYDAGTIGIYGPSGGDPAMDLIATDIYINKFGYNTGLVTALNQGGYQGRNQGSYNDCSLIRYSTCTNGCLSDSALVRCWHCIRFSRSLHVSVWWWRRSLVGFSMDRISLNQEILCRGVKSKEQDAGSVH